VAATREHHIVRIAAVLRAAQSCGLAVDHHDFERVRDDALEIADDDGRSLLREITWEDVRIRL
jgi:hypothetical protein